MEVVEVVEIGGAAGAAGAGGAAAELAACRGPGPPCRGAGRRMDSRVIASSMATPSAARPPTSAISEPRWLPPMEETLATGLAPSACAEPGATVGNRPAALPAAALTAGVGAATPTGAMVDADDRLAPTAPVGARTMTLAAAVGAVGRLAALAVTVRLTEVTLAVTGMVTSACSCRWAELASTAPRSHTDVPSPLPQPKLKPGMPAPALACSASLKSGTLPPTVQAPTTHWAVCPS